MVTVAQLRARGRVGIARQQIAQLRQPSTIPRPTLSPEAEARKSQIQAELNSILKTIEIEKNRLKREVALSKSPDKATRRKFDAKAGQTRNLLRGLTQKVPLIQQGLATASAVEEFAGAKETFQRKSLKIIKGAGFKSRTEFVRAKGRTQQLRDVTGVDVKEEKIPKGALVAFENIITGERISARKAPSNLFKKILVTPQGKKIRDVLIAPSIEPRKQLGFTRISDIKIDETRMGATTTPTLTPEDIERNRKLTEKIRAGADTIFSIFPSTIIAERETEKQRVLAITGEQEFFGGKPFSELTPTQQKGTAEVTNLKFFSDEELIKKLPFGALDELILRKQGELDTRSKNIVNKNINKLTPEFQAILNLEYSKIVKE